MLYSPWLCRITLPFALIRAPSFPLPSDSSAPLLVLLLLGLIVRSIKNTGPLAFSPGPVCTFVALDGRNPRRAKTTVLRAVHTSNGKTRTPNKNRQKEICV